MKKILVLLSFFLASLSFTANSTSIDALSQLQKIYPENIKTITTKYIVWKDGSRTSIRSSSPIVDWINSLIYRIDTSYGSFSNEDVLNDNYEPFFKKMYGQSAKDVRKNLVKIYWMPRVFGQKYPLYITKVNDVDKKIKAVSDELEQLPPSYYQYLEKPASSFYWRNVAGQNYLSMHSFGIAIDINLKHSNYWLWDFQKLKRPISDLHNYKLKYQNHIPLKIVEIFEKHGFFWGGNWYFYDTMHFEYRPEVIAMR